MIINLIETDPSDASASAAIKGAWQQAANILGSMFTDNITVNINVTYGVTNGNTGGASAGPSTGLYESYQSVYNLLRGNASPGDTTFASLPNTTTIQGASNVAVWNAQLKALGLLSGTNTAIDGNADFGTGISSSNMLSVALHEFTHALGRIPFGDSSGNPDIFDLFRFTSQGNRLFAGGNTAVAAYFSTNGGATRWADYGQASDPSDMLNTYQANSETHTSLLTPEDSFNQFYDSNTLQYLTPFDLEQMVALGFHVRQFAPSVENFDFNGDNSGDILVQNGSGVIAYANTFGGTFQGWVNLTNVPGWTLEGQGKISGSVDSNPVIENSSGQILYGNLVNGAFSNWVAVAMAPGFNVVGVGDINRDKHADIVIQNPNTGQIVYANMANGSFANWAVVGSTPGWTVRGVADINDDGFADIIIQNSSGAIAYANMANGGFSNWTSIASSPGFTVIGAGDINRDGFSDVVVQNSSSGQIAYADLKNGVFNNWVVVGSTPGWNAVAVEDVNGNGFDDIVIQNQSTGQIAYANMTTGTFQGWVGIASAPGYTVRTDPAMVGDSVPTPVTMQDPDGIPTALTMLDLGSVSTGASMFDPESVLTPVTMHDQGNALTHLPMTGTGWLTNGTDKSAWMAADFTAQNGGSFGKAIDADLSAALMEGNLHRVA